MSSATAANISVLVTLRMQFIAPLAVGKMMGERYGQDEKGRCLCPYCNFNCKIAFKVSPGIALV